MFRTVRLFLGGDYQFLATNYGHQGAACTLFCLYCLATLEDKSTNPSSMNVLWGEGKTKKTLESLEIETGKKAIFPIEIDMLVPLPLHIILGLTKDYLLAFLEKVCFSFLIIQDKHSLTLILIFSVAGLGSPQHS